MDINGQRYNAIPSQQLDITPSVIYVGYATHGAATGVAAWTIKRIRLDASGNPTDIMYTAENAAVWTNRAAESYT